MLFVYCICWMVNGNFLFSLSYFIGILMLLWWKDEVCMRFLRTYHIQTRTEWKTIISSPFTYPCFMFGTFTIQCGQFRFKTPATYKQITYKHTNLLMIWWRPFEGFHLNMDYFVILKEWKDCRLLVRLSLLIQWMAFRFSFMNWRRRPFWTMLVHCTYYC